MIKCPIAILNPLNNFRHLCGKYIFRTKTDGGFTTDASVYSRKVDGTIERNVHLPKFHADILGFDVGIP